MLTPSVKILMIEYSQYAMKLQGVSSLKQIRFASANENNDITI